MKMRLRITILLVTITVAAWGQDSTKHFADTLPDKFYIIENITRNGETMPEIALDEVSVKEKMSVRQRFKWWKYRRLVYNVRKVYPYSQIVSAKLAEVNDTLATFSDDGERRKFLKLFEREMFGDYEDDLRNMTITQGKILIKLIDRETQNSSYELIKEYRGTVSAAFWQGIARIFGSNLKAEYDPDGDDYLIEKVIYEIEAGRIRPSGS